MDVTHKVYRCPDRECSCTDTAVGSGTNKIKADFVLNESKLVFVAVQTYPMETFAFKAGFSQHQDSLSVWEQLVFQFVKL